MTEWGGKIPDVTIDELQSKLTDVDDGKAVKRLFVAIAYKQGMSPTDIEATFGIPRTSVYQWLDRIEERGFTEALYDEPKPGRPPKLTDEQFATLEEALDGPPADAGYDEREWTPELVRRFLDSRFDVEYTPRHVRRLMSDSRTP